MIFSLPEFVDNFVYVDPLKQVTEAVNKSGIAVDTDRVQAH